jgi:hypothetical protein
MIQTQDDDSVASIPTDGLKSRDKPRNLTPISSTHSSLSPLPVQMDMKDTFSRGPAVIDGLHCPSQRVAPYLRTDRMIFHILIVRNGMVTREQNEPPAV